MTTMIKYLQLITLVFLINFFSILEIGAQSDINLWHNINAGVGEGQTDSALCPKRAVEAKTETKQHSHYVDFSHRSTGFSKVKKN